jgi:hypothetical protein
MKQTPFWDKIVSTASWLIVVALLYAAVGVWIQPPMGDGPVSQLFGVLGAQVFYSALYVLLSSLLAYSKFKRKNTMRKKVLLATYLTGFFTSLLTVLLVGWNIKLLDNLIIAVCAALCWLYWVFKTEYLTPQQFEEHIESQSS